MARDGTKLVGTNAQMGPPCNWPSFSTGASSIYEYVEGDGSWNRDHDLVDDVLGIVSGHGKPGAEEITQLEAETWYREAFRAPMSPPVVDW